MGRQPPESAHLCRCAQHSPEGFLQKRALPRAMLRRQHSSKKLQRFWHDVYQAQLTTHHLAASFIRTGVPRVQLEPPQVRLAAGARDTPSRSGLGLRA